MSEQQAPGQFSIQRIYVKDISFEAPNSPKVFLAPWNPEVAVNLGTKVSRLDDSKNYEVVLSLTVTVTNDKTTAFLVEVHQAGIFAIEGVPEAQLAPLLGSYCPNVLFPYAREAVSDIVTRGSFPQLLLAPVNFDAMFADSQRRLAEGAPAGSPETMQ